MVGDLPQAGPVRSCQNTLRTTRHRRNTKLRTRNPLCTDNQGASFRWIQRPAPNLPGTARMMLRLVCSDKTATQLHRTRCTAAGQFPLQSMTCQLLTAAQCQETATELEGIYAKSCLYLWAFDATCKQARTAGCASFCLGLTGEISCWAFLAEA